MSVDEKQCFRCNETKPLSEFYGNRSRWDGHSDECKDCNKALRKDYYNRNRRQIIARNKAYYYVNRDEINARRKQKYHAEKAQAETATAAA